MNLLGLTYSQVTDQFRHRYGKGAFHAAALYRNFFQQADLDLDRIQAFSDSPVLRQRVQADLGRQQIQLFDRFQQHGVTKLIFGLADGLRIEAVVIPMANHATVCVSCQVGCRMGCRFCRTGAMGWRRDLTAAEIVAQVHMVKVRLGFKVRNVVFMGMGEPLDNFESVIQAIRVLEDQRGMDIAKRHMTLSTVGIAPAIERLAAMRWPQLKLAVSLNAPDDTIRGELMPINTQYPMGMLKQALARYPLAKGGAIFFEYVLIKGINDHPRHAADLAAYFEGLPVKLNLIPYNPGRRSDYRAPLAEDLCRFHQALIDQRIFVRLRSAKGAEIRAACGQLGGGAGGG